VLDILIIPGGHAGETMPSEATREEFEARVGVLEREVEGEKMVTRHVLEQARRNSDDLAAIKTRLDRVESRLDGVESRLVGVESGLGRVDGKVDSLTRSLPEIVGEAVREAFREERKGNAEFSKRSPDERSDIRDFRRPTVPHTAARR